MALRGLPALASFVTLTTVGVLVRCESAPSPTANRSASSPTAANSQPASPVQSQPAVSPRLGCRTNTRRSPPGPMTSLGPNADLLATGQRHYGSHTAEFVEYHGWPAITVGDITTLASVRWRHGIAGLRVLHLARRHSRREWPREVRGDEPYRLVDVVRRRCSAPTKGPMRS